MMRVAVIPVKRLDQAKSRLAPVLDDAGRRALVLFLLDRTLEAIGGCADIDDSIVVGADPETADLARRHGAVFLAEPPGAGLNPALDAARQAAMDHGAGTILVLPADLPLLTAAALTSALVIPSKPYLVIVGDRRQRGTNLLFFAPADGFPFAFGGDSYVRHVAAAEAARYALVEREAPDIAFDIDTPEDLAAARTMIDIPDFRKASS